MPPQVGLRTLSRGDVQEGWNCERYSSIHDWQAWENQVLAAGFVELTHYYRPAGLSLEAQPWLASVWRKPMVRS